MTTAEPPLQLDAATREAVAELLLSVADDEFVIGFWDSEWTGIAPMLEEDVAMSSIAQDEIGHARALYELLAEVTDDDADRIAFGRDPDAFRHAALLNHPRRDWAFTVARRYLYDTADAVRQEALAHGSWPPLAGLAAKMRREETYHLLHMDAWIRRLAEARDDARGRLEASLEQLWPDAQSVFTPLSGEQVLLAAGVLVAPLEELRRRWLERTVPALGSLGLPAPGTEERAATPPADGRTRRTDDFRWLHGEFTMVARSQEGATW
jgi:ring-1,2-phenylacetyl-CoA epoxidase subunit PaaC